MSQANNNKHPHLVSFLQTIPYWFATVVGIIYGAGFLIDYTFLSSLGIRDSGVDPIRAKYLYVGSLGVLFPVLGGAAILTGFYLYRTKAKIYVASIALQIVLLFDFYLLVAITGPSFLKEHPLEIGSLFITTIVTGIVLRGLDDAYEAKLKCSELSTAVQNAKIRLHRKKQGYMRLAVLCLTIALSVWTFYSLGGLGQEIIWEGGWLYLAFLSLALFLLLWIVSAIEKFSQVVETNAGLISCICLPVGLIYISVLVFAHRIYPFIPVSRGGGDYSRGDKSAVLIFNPVMVSSLPMNLVDRTTSAFRYEHVLDSASLIEAIAFPKTNLAQFLFDKLSDDEKHLLADKNRERGEQVELIVDILNFTIHNGFIYNPERFSKTALSQKMRSLVAQSPQPSGDEAIRVNRLLLEEGFAGMLGRPTSEDVDISPKISQSISWPVTVLSENQNSIFVTLRTSREDRAQWRHLAVKPKNIYAITRSAIVSISK